MAQGFGELTYQSRAALARANAAEGGFDTLFERVKKEAGGEKKSLTWYRATTQRLGKQYKANFDKFLRDEKRDSIDETINADSNELRRWAVQGHMYLFEYPDPESKKKLKYWDTYPLVYVIRSNLSLIHI